MLEIRQQPTVSLKSRLRHVTLPWLVLFWILSSQRMPDALINYHTTDLLPVTHLPCASWHTQDLLYRGGPPLISVSHKLRRSFPPFHGYCSSPCCLGPYQFFFSSLAPTLLRLTGGSRLIRLSMDCDRPPTDESIALMNTFSGKLSETGARSGRYAGWASWQQCRFARSLWIVRDDRKSRLKK